MNLEVNCERNGLRVKVLIITANLETHSALQEIHNEYVNVVLSRIQMELSHLLDQAYACRKQP